MGTVVDAINFTKPSYKSNIDLLTHYFNQQPTVLIPPKDTLFKFEIGQQVRVNSSKKKRQDLSFKYSLTPGKRRFLNKKKTIFFSLPLRNKKPPLLFVGCRQSRHDKRLHRTGPSCFGKKKFTASDV
jgi:hypothetical protein